MLHEKKNTFFGFQKKININHLRLHILVYFPTISPIRCPFYERCQYFYPSQNSWATRCISYTIRKQLSSDANFRYSQIRSSCTRINLFMCMSEGVSRISLEIVYIVPK